MRHERNTIAIGCALLLSLPMLASAVIQSEVVAVIGAEIEADAPKPRGETLSAEGLALFELPSMTWGGDARAKHRLVGLALGVLPLSREADLASLPLPSEEQMLRLRLALRKLGVKNQPQLLLVVMHRGGK